MTQSQQSHRPPHRTPADVDPDVRFLLANERTMLAWLRTGLALQAGGVVLFQVGDAGGAARPVLTVALLAVGMVCHVAGWRRYRAADSAIRAARLPARGLAPDLLVLGLLVLTVAVAAALLAAG